MNSYTNLNKTHLALLTIDVQKDVIPAIPGSLEVLPSIKRLVEASRGSNIPIIHIVRLYLQDGSNVDLCRRPDIEQGKQFLIAGTKGAELVDELKSSPNIQLDTQALLQERFQKISNQEWILYKPRWGAFYQTNLEDHLKQIEVDTLVICGYNFPNCPRTTIYEASERDFRIIVIQDAVSGIYDRGTEELKNIGASLMGTQEWIDWLNAKI